MNIRLPHYIDEAITILEHSGHCAYVVGGCVRDFLRGVVPHDYDICTSALPEEICAAFDSYHLIRTGIKHGTVTVIFQSNPIEITTFRVDGEYTDSRHPESVTFTRNIIDDLARRDFTINAIAYHPQIGMIDPFLGTADLDKGIIRCVGDANKRFREDGLRILRALRFAAQTGFEIERQTFDAMVREKALLNQISYERINTEFSKLITAPYAGKTLRKARDIIAQFIPEIAYMFDFEQNNPHHLYDVWEHTIRAIEMSNNDLTIRLSVLLHDIGKPATATIDENGIGHFYGHPKMSASIAKEILTRLRFSKKITNDVIFLVLNHDSPLGDNEKIIRRRLASMGEELFRKMLMVKKADCCGQGTHQEYIEKFLYFDRTLENIIKSEVCFSLKDLAVNGKDIIALGIRGKAVGDKLQFLLGKVLEDPNINNKHMLLGMLQQEKR